MPTPVSLTETSTNPSFGVTATSIRPPSGVNLIAFDSRFRTTCRTLRSDRDPERCHRAGPVNAQAMNEAEVAANRLGLEARFVEVRDADELEPVFTTMARERANGVVLVPSSFLVTHGLRIVELATKRRLPVLGWTDLQARKGPPVVRS